MYVMKYIRGRKGVLIVDRLFIDNYVLFNVEVVWYF